MKKLILFCLTVAVPVSVFANSLHSAARLPSESFEKARERYYQELYRQYPDLENRNFNSAEKAAVEFDKLDLSNVPVVNSVDEVFRFIRDQRFLRTDGDFPRRASWLYPHDGCWLRAALAGDIADKQGFPRPSKVFIFGSLKVNTKNSTTGYVSWWYHVIPVVKNYLGEVYAIDPAIHPTGALPLREWTMTMVQNIQDAKLSSCDPFAFGPSSDCFQPEKGDSMDAKRHIEVYLNSEWDNLMRLKRNPTEELGDHPPWLRPNLWN